MNEVVCALAPETKIETPEGALTVKTVAGKPISVFTREPSGRVRFRRVLDAHKTSDQQPVLKVTLDNGASFRVGREQVLYRKGMLECRADDLAVGDQLEPAFHFPEGYQFHSDTGEGLSLSPGGWRVTKTEPGGVADLYSLGVNQTGCFFLAAGVLCKADCSG
ncbi:MAG: hypothetical protein HY270_18745 [Deltaproteobacteria bacterium]|nr:hypothetical protein [Deltaproteobacteria bacterium]